MEPEMEESKMPSGALRMFPTLLCCFSPSTPRSALRLLPGGAGGVEEDFYHLFSAFQFNFFDRFFKISTVSSVEYRDARLLLACVVHSKPLHIEVSRNGIQNRRLVSHYYPESSFIIHAA